MKAAAAYTKAIKLDQENAVLYSNRSAAFLKLGKVAKAIEDADECIVLKPDWEKGYFRKGQALETKGDFSSAFDTYDTYKTYPNIGNKMQSDPIISQAQLNPRLR